MTTSTRKSGAYRYYKCAGTIRVGKSLCDGRRVRMEKLDDFFLNAIFDRFLTVQKIQEILAPLMERQDASAKDSTERITTRERAVTTAKKQFENLYTLVTEGLVEAADEEFKGRFKVAKKNLAVAERERDQVTAELAPEARVNIEAITNFTTNMRQALDHPSNSAKRDYLRSVIDPIVVGEKTIQIHGRRSQIERAVIRREVAPSAVPTFVREWRRKPT